MPIRLGVLISLPQLMALSLDIRHSKRKRLHGPKGYYDSFTHTSDDEPEHYHESYLRCERIGWYWATLLPTWERSLRSSISVDL